MRAAELDELQPHASQAVFTTLSTLWLMIMQRLSGGLSMKAVLRDALEIAEDIFPDCKRVRETTSHVGTQPSVMRDNGSVLTP